MINIQNLTNVTAQSLLNEIKDMLPYYNVVMDGDDVDYIEITSLIRVSATDTQKLTFAKPSLSGTNTMQVTIPSALTLVQTEGAVHTSAFDIGQTKNILNGASSLGVRLSGSSSVVIITNSSTTIANTDQMRVTGTYDYVTQLVEVTEKYGTNVFENVYCVIGSTNRSTPIGRASLGGKNYYIDSYFAVSYV